MGSKELVICHGKAKRPFSSHLKKVTWIKKGSRKDNKNVACTFNNAFALS